MAFGPSRYLDGYKAFSTPSKPRSFAGRFIDRIGLRIGFVIFLVVWSVAAVGHAFAHQLPGSSLPALVISERCGLPGPRRNPHPHPCPWRPLSLA